jgi:hypothetical protein
MTTGGEAPASLDDLFRDLLDVIADQCGVEPAAPRPAPPLRHTGDTDLHPLVGVLAEALVPVKGRCRGGMGVRCRRTRNISTGGYCPRCQELSRQAAEAYELIAPDWDDVGWEWRNEAAAELADLAGGEVRVLWQCQELTDRDQAAGQDANTLAGAA